MDQKENLKFHNYSLENDIEIVLFYSYLIFDTLI